MLIPIYDNSFHMQASTIDFIFLKNETGWVDRTMISGRSMASRYGEVGLEFYKADEE